MTEDSFLYRNYDRASKMVSFVAKFNIEHGYGPTIRQVGESAGIRSTSLITYYINHLVEEGYLVRDERVSHSIRVGPRSYIRKEDIHAAQTE